MRIKIHDDPVGLQRARVVCGDFLWPPEFERMMAAVAGQWVEVETNHLFRDQFNTVPVPGVSELGMRVMERDTVAVEDDERVGTVKCSWCGGYDGDHDGLCDDCGKPDYLHLLK